MQQQLLYLLQQLSSLGRYGIDTTRADDQLLPSPPPKATLWEQGLLFHYFFSVKIHSISTTSQLHTTAVSQFVCCCILCFLGSSESLLHAAWFDILIGVVFSFGNSAHPFWDRDGSVRFRTSQHIGWCRVSFCLGLPNLANNNM